MSVSAIVPAHNEAPTVAEVVRALKASPLIDEVIVVSDGSSDATADVARAAGADKVLALDANVGKGGALSAGVEAARGDVLLFCDADLYGFTPAHVERLLRPVLDGKLAMCVGLRDRGPLLTWVERFLPLIGGERALDRKVFEAVPSRLMRGYAVEMALNFACRARKLAWGSVLSERVSQRRKMQKIGVVRGLVRYAGMFAEVYWTRLILESHRAEFLES